MRMLSTKCFHFVLWLAIYHLQCQSLTLRMSKVFPTAQGKYVNVPGNLELKKVVVFLRHGDRSQIARDMGSKFPENEEITKYWASKMLPLKDMNHLLEVGSSSQSRDKPLTTQNFTEAFDHLYTGRDKSSYPYGMLTTIGVRQLNNLGQILRARYKNVKAFHSLFNPKTMNKRDYIYCRSTNICRTIMSLHSLLHGLLIGSMDDPTPGTAAAIAAATTIPTHLDSVPYIVTRPKTNETLYPQADGPSIAITQRRDHLFKNNFLARSFYQYLDFEEHMKLVFGYADDNVNWLVLKDVLTCYLKHDIKFPTGITINHFEILTKLNGFIWGSMYEDKIMNRLAIGRFISEFLEDITYSPPPHRHLYDHYTDEFVVSRPLPDGKKDISPQANFYVYSGHDSTIVPILCALGIYNDEWPPYATYVAIEIAEFIENTYTDDDEEAIQLSPKMIRKALQDSDDTTFDGLEETEKEEFMTLSGKHPNLDERTLWVRVVYNDKERLIDGSGTSTTTSRGDLRVGGTWCPYDTFITNLKALSISPQEYQFASELAMQSKDFSYETMKKADEEIKATIGAIDKA